MVVRSVQRMLTAVAIAGVLLVSACGDDDDNSGDGSTSGGSGREAIKIMAFTSLGNPAYSAPQKRIGVEAAIRGINDGGGVDGRPLEFLFCDTDFDPNKEAACAQQAVEDGAVAVVGSSSFYPNTLPVLERGGIAYIGGQGLVPAELQSTVSFPISSGIPGWTFGTVASVLQQGVQRPAIVQSPIAGAQFGAQLAAAAFAAAGVEPIRTVEAPVGLPDQSAVAARVSDGADAVLVAALPGDAVKIVQSQRQAGYTGIVASITAIFTADVIAALGDSAEGIVLTSQLRPSSDSHPAIAEFNSDMDAVDPGASKDERSLASWASVKLLAEVIGRLPGEVTAASVLEAMTTLSDPVETGVTPPYSVTAAPSPLPDFPRIFNPSVVLAEVQDGRISRVGSQDFVDPFAEVAEIANR